jgi:hypothetical protein
MIHSNAPDAPSQHTSESMQNAGPSTPEPPTLSYSDNYPPRPYNYDARTPTFNPLNSAEITTSSTVQGRNVVNIAVQYYEPAAPGADGYSTTDAHNVAQMSIVIDDDTASQGSNDYEPIQLYQCRIVQQDLAGALAVSEMQVRKH